MNNLTVVINTLNEEKNIERAIKSVSWADEVIVCDMYSEDKTVDIAKKLGAKVIYHKKTGYVEPARNYAISKAAGPWVLILDADEEIPVTLSEELKRIADNKSADFVAVPRRNMIFGKGMENAMWWPDYNIRFFKKGKVIWGDKIHLKPQTQGQGLELPPVISNAIIHHHYTSVSQFIERLNRYTTIQAKELKEDGYKFDWRDLITKPSNELFSRYFALKGYKDGIHGLALSLLQSFSHLVMYLKVWELEKFEEREISLNDIKAVSAKNGADLKYWINHSLAPKNLILRKLKRIKDLFE